MKQTLRAWFAKLSTWGRIALLTALPFAGEIKSTLDQNLPALQPYLPENVYKFMGAAVVIVGMILSLAKVHQAVKAAHDA